MKVVIFAGGLGTRLGEETFVVPKPMIKIGGYPIIWHIMKIYSFYGFDDFIILCGYKGDIIKKYFTDYCIVNSDITVDYLDNSIEIHKKTSEKWKVTMIDTGLNVMTGARLKKIQAFLKDDTFFLTYGDGLANINPQKVLEMHHKSGRVLIH